MKERLLSQRYTLHAKVLMNVTIFVTKYLYFEHYSSVASLTSSKKLRQHRKKPLRVSAQTHLYDPLRSRSATSCSALCSRSIVVNNLEQFA